MKTTNKDRRELRTFGLLIGGVFLLIGLWPAISGSEAPRIGVSALGFALAGLGAFAPQSLKHAHRVWMKIGHVLGWINTSVLLGFIFYGLIFPMGILMRLFRKMPIDLGRSDDLASYRVMRKARSREHMKRQF